ncbi:hypothetical protein [Chitinophaga barathri]|uniref:DUF3823 domain-containing protein n=1 Tax=Chitinophaga barathri TaxID=1647451 RepID=A0A3N4M7S4_9BACT|nr:hypothetical protein [Chitinophaga barathri]RPD39594.1 hypothetical protein EG028_18260 [Chitinophaga barathri]
MKKTINIVCLLILLLAAACKKEGDFVVKPLKAIEPVTFAGGYVLGDTLTLYFDGVKMRDYFGPIGSDWETTRIAFEEDRASMELKRKKTGETVYQKTFDIKDADNAIPKLYFDGAKMQPAYTYPTPQGAEYTANFYLDFPAGSGTADISLEMIEYRMDGNTPVILGVTSVPIASNIQPGKWTEYVTLPMMPTLPNTHPESGFAPYICVKKAGKNEYYVVNKDEEIFTTIERNSLQLQLPDEYTTNGLVQSYHLYGKTYSGISAVISNDLVRVFPK